MGSVNGITFNANIVRVIPEKTANTLILQLVHIAWLNLDVGIELLCMMAALTLMASMPTWNLVPGYLSESSSHIFGNIEL